METGEHHSKAKTIWLLVILFIFAVSNTVWGLLYIKQSGENQQVSSQVATLNSEKTDLDAKIKKLEVAQAEKIETQKEEDATKWREIPELGVRFKETDKNMDLTYSYDQLENDETTIDIIYLSTTEIIQASEKDDSGRSACASQYGPTGAIAKYKAGTMLPVVGTKVDDVKDAVKVGDYYLIYQKSQAPCSDSTEKEQTSAAAIAYQTFKTLQPIE